MRGEGCAAGESGAGVAGAVAVALAAAGDACCCCIVVVVDAYLLLTPAFALVAAAVVVVVVVALEAAVDAAIAVDGEAECGPGERGGTLPFIRL